MESVRPCLCVPLWCKFVVKMWRKDVVKIFCGINLSYKYSGNVMKHGEKMSCKHLVCGENLPKHPEISLKKSCDYVNNQSQT